MTIDEARERVERGAALLDAKQPGWREKVNPETLQMQRACGLHLGAGLRGLRDRGGQPRMGRSGLQRPGIPGPVQGWLRPPPRCLARATASREYRMNRRQQETKRRPPAEASNLERSLLAVAAAARGMAPHCEDLHVLATEHPKKGDQTRRSPPGPRDPASGDPRAKAAMKSIDARCRSLLTAIGDADALLHSGAAPEALRGSLLGGGDGSGVRAELGRLRAAQRRRRERGEYVPHRDWPQPSGSGQ